MRAILGCIGTAFTAGICTTLLQARRFRCLLTRANGKFSLDCETLKKWLQKCQDDSETANYINANTKDVRTTFPRHIIDVRILLVSIM